MQSIVIIPANATLVSSTNNFDVICAAFLSELDAKQSSREQYGRALRQYFNWICSTGRSLANITRVDIIAYRDGMLAQGAGKSSLTAASYLTAVKMFYKWAAGRDYCNDVAAGVKLPKRASKFNREPLTPTQAQQLMEEAATASPRDNAIVNLLTRAGLRTIEVTRANVGDLALKGGQPVLYVQGKGRDSKDSFVILSGKCYAALRAYLATRPTAAAEDPLFTSDSHRNNGGRLTTRTIRQIAKDNLENIGLSNRSYTAHSLRHTCAVSMLRTGATDKEVQSALRHSNPATTQIYTYHLDEQRRLESAVENRLDNLF